MDEERKLMLVGDDDRVKSFSWESVTPDGSRLGNPKPVHTLKASSHRGPIAILPNGRILRAGPGSALMWVIDDLEIHGPNRARIGRGKYSTRDSWRDNDDDSIELSNGSQPHGTVSFSETTLRPSMWRLHRPSGGMLFAEWNLSIKKYSCGLLDLEHGGRIATRFIGFGGFISDMSISDANLNLFATSCSDGYARLFDVRHPLPAVTLNAGSQADIYSAAYPDGIPTVFTGGHKIQQIRMWDIRAGAIVYELATGNNEVTSLAWDPKHASLYASMECPGIDRIGYHHDCRVARVPKWGVLHPQPESPTSNNPTRNKNDDDSDSEQDEDEDEDEDELGRCWPDRSYHDENYFRYCFDAGDHRLYRFAFKPNADPLKLPEYGQATLDQGYW
ncbi:uncharacterized protein FIBRA_00795 [Fibroporia radiculosa]|uniref:DUF2415 domain-containing protein n=1 Tax=Fibroporia radiculosa TaxID=599839 RepID=J4GIM0_9APHY|nr:uncharacterized protein FIBRA_00795 [Fibroporia radiculosa]CCL98790.1 predicted protein [Fibroporia radiculosa]